MTTAAATFRAAARRARSTTMRPRNNTGARRARVARASAPLSSCRRAANSRKACDDVLKHTTFQGEILQELAAILSRVPPFGVQWFTQDAAFYSSSILYKLLPCEALYSLEPCTAVPCTTWYVSVVPPLRGPSRPKEYRAPQLATHNTL